MERLLYVVRHGMTDWNQSGRIQGYLDPPLNATGRAQARAEMARLLADLSAAVEEFMRSGEPILVAKANARSLVHRRVYMDYIGVKTYDADGRVNGEERFVGLFTAEAYNRPASDIPLLRAKEKKVVATAGFLVGGHNEKALLNILETFPRDEMFQLDLETLAVAPGPAAGDGLGSRVEGGTHLTVEDGLGDDQGQPGGPVDQVGDGGRHPGLHLGPQDVDRIGHAVHLGPGLGPRLGRALGVALAQPGGVALLPGPFEGPGRLGRPGAGGGERARVRHRADEVDPAGPGRLGPGEHRAGDELS